MNEQVIGKENPLGTERIGKLMLRYAIPSIISLMMKRGTGTRMSGTWSGCACSRNGWTPVVRW